LTYRKTSNRRPRRL